MADFTGCSDILFFPQRFAESSRRVRAEWPRIGTFMGRMFRIIGLTVIATFACKLLGIANSVSNGLLLGSLGVGSASIVMILAMDGSFFLAAVMTSLFILSTTNMSLQR